MASSLVSESSFFWGLATLQSWPKQEQGRKREPSAANREQLLARRLKSLDDHLGHAFHQLVTQVMVLLARLAQPRAVEENGGSALHRARVEVPIVRRGKPGPTEDVPGSNA